MGILTAVVTGLVISNTTYFEDIWNDKGSGAKDDGGFWHPVSRGGLRPLGSVGVNNYNDINGVYSAILVGQETGAPQALSSPIDFTSIWDDIGKPCQEGWLLLEAYMQVRLYIAGRCCPVRVAISRTLVESGACEST